MSWLNLENKTVIITGGASGIGKAVAEEFINQGSNVVIFDLAPEEPEYLKNIKNTKYYSLDVTNKEQVDNAILDVIKTFGSIDILVNNAGINIPALIVDSVNPEGKYELNLNIWDKTLDVNLNGVFICTQAALRDMVKNNYGVIINMSSESGLEGSEGQSIYAASKAALNSLTRSWCKELGKYNIRVVGIAPGIMEATGLRTPAYEEALSYTRGITVDQLRAGYSNKSTTPLQRSGKLSEVANLCVFLASDKGGYIDGVTYNVAGGKTRG